MLSFWEKKHLVKADYLIIGGGLVGLTAAVQIKEFRPSARVLVLERGLLPSGASSRNAGFACFGSLSELLADWQTMGQDRALALVEKRWRGLQMLQRRLGAKNIGLLRYGGYELLREPELHYLERVEEVNNWLYPLFRQKVFYNAEGKVEEFGFNRQIVKGMILNPLEAQIDTGLMMKNLYEYAITAGVQVLTGSRVNKVEGEAGTYVVSVSNPNGGEEVEFSARAVGVCTNAFARHLLPKTDLKPGRGQVLITEPIPNLPFKGTFHIEEGYYYFRNYGRQVILGGGRNLDFKAETSTALELNESIQNHLKDMLRTTLLPGQDIKIQHKWSGIMAFGPTKEPIVKTIQPGLALGVRLGGMGVALGSEVGSQVAELMLNQE
jgi:glycine/D-amino acid oxidase-like deaminating enzyme